MIYLDHACLLCSHGMILAYKQDNTNQFFWCCDECEVCFSLDQDVKNPQNYIFSFDMDEERRLRPCESIEEIEEQGVCLTLNEEFLPVQTYSVSADKVKE